MAFCKKCGAQIGEDEKFCPNCGQAVAPEAAQVVEPSSDVQENKGVSVLSYLGPLVFIPLFAKKDSPYAQFHAKQGLNLFACGVIVAIVFAILSAIFKKVLALSIIISILQWGCNVFITVLAIIGIVHAAKGETVKLPLIGDLNVYGWFAKKN